MPETVLTVLDQIGALPSLTKVLLLVALMPAAFSSDAVGTPMVAIFGPTDWIVTPPFGKTHTIVRHEIECSPCLKRVCPLGHHDCMKKVDVAQVLRACEEQLK